MIVKVTSSIGCVCVWSDAAASISRVDIGGNAVRRTRKPSNSKDAEYVRF